MESAVAEIGEAVISEVLQEAVDELTGKSGRKWAVILVAFVLGGVIAAVIIRKRRRAAAVPDADQKSVR